MYTGLRPATDAFPGPSAYGYVMTWSGSPPRWGPPWGRRPSRYVVWLVVAWIQVGGTYFASQHSPTGSRDYDLLGAALLFGSATLLLWRRQAPELVLFGTVALTAVYWVLGYPEGPIFVAEIFAFIGAILCGKRVAAIAALVVGYPIALWLPTVFDTRPSPSIAQAVAVAAWLAALFAGAEFARSRREAMIEMRKAEAEERRRRASEQRMEIARELHDVLAHNISLINVQANVGLHLMKEKPEQTREALTAIKEVSAETLGELRSVLDVLRGDADEAPRSPTSGLAHLDDLLQRTRDAGLDVTKRIEGAERAVPPEVDLAAFRIVQEALTNVTRHSGSSTARVTLAFSEDELAVRVEDDGNVRVVDTESGGSGIEGMRERAVALGGKFLATALPGRGFRVHAQLPLRVAGSS